jgi:DUF971 family protein
MSELNTQIASINARTLTKVLELGFADGAQFSLSFEYLRVHSPSAEVRGHGAGQEVLQTGKRAVGLLGIEPVGNYAIKILFDDGHQTGIYTWKYLRELADNQASFWQSYLLKLQAAGFVDESGRDYVAPPVSGKSCSKS